MADDDGLVIMSDSIRMPLELATAFRGLLVELSCGESDVVIVDDAYATVKCRAEDVPKARLLWRGFQAGIRHLAEIIPPASAMPRST